ncbi:MAG TPA: DUF1206 domain-containing protein, partial [Methylomirabilota bacterium]|nr:DUF1206 domain-containing protein [Methylomirabilota bacterium]
VAIVLAALQLCYRAWIGDVDRWLDLREIDRPDRALVLALGRFGLAARGLVFGTGGVILASAALHGSPWAARGLGGTLRVLQASAGGPVVLAAIGVGLMSFGVIEVVSAHLRRSLPHDEAAAG